MKTAQQETTFTLLSFST